MGFFDGIPGWLIFGANRYLEGRSIEEVKEIAVSVALSELRNLIESRRVSEIVGRRYAHAIKRIASGQIPRVASSTAYRGVREA